MNRLALGATAVSIGCDAAGPAGMASSTAARSESFSFAMGAASFPDSRPDDSSGGFCHRAAHPQRVARFCRSK